MRKKRYLQEIVTTGRLTLPVAIVIVSLFWLVGNLSTLRTTDDYLLWSKLSAFLQGPVLRGIIAYLLLGVAFIQLLVLHNRFSLIRTHSNFHLTLFALLVGLLVPHTLHVSGALIPCLLFATYYLFKTYQVSEPVGYVFQSFFFIGLGSLFFPTMLYYLPLMYLSLAAFNALTRRTFFAGLTGICLPFWIAFAYTFCTGQLELFLGFFQRLVPTWPPTFESWGMTEILPLAYILFLTVAGSLHCLINNYEDKIRTRAYLTHFISLQGWTLLLLLMQPHHYSTLFPLLATGCCTPAAHLFVLWRTKASNLFFLLCALLFIAILLFYVWTHSHNLY